MELVKKIMLADGVWENLSTKDLDKETFEPVPDWQYVIGRVDGEPVGLGIIHTTEQGYNKCHVQVLPEYRKEHGLKFGLDGMKFIWANNTFDFMVASISSKFPNVRKYAEAMGFELVKTRDKWYKEEGRDAWLFVAKRQ
jgi:hypothetical protein